MVTRNGVHCRSRTYHQPYSNLENTELSQLSRRMIADIPRWLAGRLRETHFLDNVDVVHIFDLCKIWE